MVDGFGDRGREESGSALLWEAGEDAGDVVFEAEIEESVRFIEDENLEGGLWAVDMWGGEELEKASWGSDEEIGGVLEEGREILGWGGGAAQEEL